MQRPSGAYLKRAGERIPMELCPTPGDFKDGYEHWSAACRVEVDDRFEVHELWPGLVIHFENAVLVRGHRDDGVALFRLEPVQ